MIEQVENKNLEINNIMKKIAWYFWRNTLNKIYILIFLIILWIWKIYWVSILTNISNFVLYSKIIYLTTDWTDSSEKKIILDGSIWSILSSWTYYNYWNLTIEWTSNFYNDLSISSNLITNQWWFWDSSINSNDIIDWTIISQDIQDWTIITNDILDWTITTNDILDWTIVWNDIQNNNVMPNDIINTQNFSLWGININWNWNEWSINSLSNLVWYDDLFIKSNSSENQNTYYWANWHIFYTNWIERMRIDSIWNVWIWKPNTMSSWVVNNSLNVSWWILAYWNWNNTWWDTRARIWVLNNWDSCNARWFSASTSNTLWFVQGCVWERLSIDRNWKVWVWTSTPNTKLEINWWVKIWTDNWTCNSSKEATIRYNSSTNKMEYCNWTIRRPFPPIAPVAIASTSLTQTSITRNWQASVWAYRYEWSTDWTTWVNKWTSLTHTETWLSQWVQYTRFVRACNFRWCWAVTTLWPTRTIPPNPVASASSSITQTSITRNRQASVWATWYEWSTDWSNWINNSTNLSRNETWLLVYKPYTRYARACNSAWCSGTTTLPQTYTLYYTITYSYWSQTTCPSSTKVLKSDFSWILGTILWVSNNWTFYCWSV